MDSLVVVAVVAMLVVFGASALLTNWARQQALAKQRLDMPNERSSHTTPTPRGGGIGIVVAFLGAVLVLGVVGALEWRLVIALWAGAVVAVVGYLDDMRGLSANVRIIFHFAAAIVGVLALGEFPIINLGGYGIQLGWFGSVLAVAATVWMINLYNFMDGIDGIAGLEVMTVTGVIGVLLVINGNPLLALCMGLLFASAGGFLTLNFPPAKIFMGDIASGFLGYVLAILAVATAQQGIGLWSWLILLAIFVIDTFITLVRRLARGDKWHQAHRTHAYQHATTMLGSHKKTLTGVFLINVIWLTPLAILAQSNADMAVIFAVIALIPIVALAFYFGAGKAVFSRQRVTTTLTT